MARTSIPRHLVAWILGAGILGAWGLLISLSYILYSRFTGLVGVFLVISVAVFASLTLALNWWSPKRPSVVLYGYSLSIGLVVVLGLVNQVLAGLWWPFQEPWAGALPQRYIGSEAHFFVIFDLSVVFALISAAGALKAARLVVRQYSGV